MQKDFHYYATYCAAYIAGFSHDECLEIAYSAQFVDVCSRTLLKKINAPLQAATTQLQMELMDSRVDIFALHDITRIWTSFHFLPADLYAKKKWRTKVYLNRYRLICGPNGDLLVDTVDLAKGKTTQAIGIAMHVLADTWAHMYFAGTPSLVINNTNFDFFEIIKDEEGFKERKINFKHNVSMKDNIDSAVYVNCIYSNKEISVMNLGHGRAGHIPDYSFIKYRYMPAWNDFKLMIKDNPTDYFKAFAQMVYALKYIRGEYETFEKNTYDFKAIEKYSERIKEILEKRQPDASEDWKKLGEELSGQEIEDFDIEKYQSSYRTVPADMKEKSFIGKFVTAALAHKKMVTSRIIESNNTIAGFRL
ncbi:MAG: hypothetical protein K6F75_13565 [Butyrivibrio sp.]|nr:hypothetical protein [Butyrivibrio sp.]